MMRKNVVVIVACLIAGLVGTAGAVTINLPWYTGSDGNPYTDAMGNTWTASGTTSIVNYDTSTYTTLAWDGSEWGSGNTIYGPGDADVQRLKGANNGVETTVLQFTPGAAGTYSLFGAVTSTNAIMRFTIALVDGTTSGVTVLYGKNPWNDEDLSTFSELQNLSLDTNDTILFMSSSVYAGQYGNIVLTNAGFEATIVPEPVTACLLAIGGMMAFSRRKR